MFESSRATGSKVCDSSKSPSFVYAIEAIGTGTVKIGVSSDVQRRLNDLSTACPFELRIVATFEGGEHEERRLHAEFEEYRVRGEWFRFEGNVKQFIEEHNEA